MNPSPSHPIKFFYYCIENVAKVCIYLHYSHGCLCWSPSPPQSFSKEIPKWRVASQQEA